MLLDRITSFVTETSFIAVICLPYAVLSNVFFQAISGGGQVAGLMISVIQTYIDSTFDLTLYTLKTFMK